MFPLLLLLLSLLFSFQGAKISCLLAKNLSFSQKVWIRIKFSLRHMPQVFFLDPNFFFHQKEVWWAWEDSNLRPHAYQACALTTWATSPRRRKLGFFRRRFFSLSFALGGDEEDRTPDPLLARQVLSQLSYTPIFTGLRTFLLNFHFLKVLSPFRSLAPSKLNNDLLDLPDWPRIRVLLSELTSP